MSNKTIYFLIGFMGSGKSLLGKRVAQSMGFSFIEMDEEIETAAGQEIKDIFKEQGEDYFRHLERKVLLDIIQQGQLNSSSTIVSTGGGAACFLGNIDWMKKSGKVIYIRPSQEVLLQRLIDGMEDRPLLHGKTEAELKAYISTTLSKRDFFYTQADWILNPLLDSKTANAQLLEALIKAYSAE